MQISKRVWTTIKTAGKGTATVIALFTLWYTLTPATLVYSETPHQSLLAVHSCSNHNLELRVDGTVVNDPFLSEVKIENNSWKPIKPDAFTDSFPGSGPGLLLKVSNPKCRILTADVTRMQPSNRPLAKLSINRSQTGLVAGVAIKPIGLNPSDSFELRLITDGDPGKITVDGYLTDCKIQTASYNWEQLYNLISSAFSLLQTVGSLLSFVWLFMFLFVFYTVYSIFMLIKRQWRKFTFNSKIGSHVASPAHAQKILASTDDFDALAKTLELKTTEEVSMLRTKLAEHIGPLADHASLPAASTESQSQNIPVLTTGSSADNSAEPQNDNENRLLTSDASA